MKEFFLRPVTKIEIVASILLLGGIFAAVFLNFRETIYNYNLTLPPGQSAQMQLTYGAQPALANAEFFKNTRDSLISQKTNFIEADLAEMKLKLYENGAAIKEFPIVAKGKEGSYFETPSGLYKIEVKEKEHFSTFGEVYQPWSMQFQGNFFIHGWPYYPDGPPVASTYSGGCIRLNTADAEEVFRWAKPGIPILVFKPDSAKDDFSYNLKMPEISAKSFLAADLGNNFVFMEKDPETVLPVASVSKILATLVAQEYINLEQKLIVTPTALATTSLPRLVAGEKISAFDLLYLLLMESSNEAAGVFSETLGAKRFVELMNQKAQSIGMSHSNFTDAAGVNESNVSTARDIFYLAKNLYYNRQFILNATSGRFKDVGYKSKKFTEMNNFNALPEFSEFIGGKIGKSTGAEEAMLAIFEPVLGNQKRPVAIIALASENVKKDVSAILNWILKTY